MATAAPPSPSPRPEAPIWTQRQAKPRQCANQHGVLSPINRRELTALIPGLKPQFGHNDDAVIAAVSTAQRAALSRGWLVSCERRHLDRAPRPCGDGVGGSARAEPDDSNECRSHFYLPSVADGDGDAVLLVPGRRRGPMHRDRNGGRRCASGGRVSPAPSPPRSPRLPPFPAFPKVQLDLDGGRCASGCHTGIRPPRGVGRRVRSVDDDVDGLQPWIGHLD